MRTQPQELPATGGSLAPPTPPNSPEHRLDTLAVQERNTELAAACRMGLARVVRESLKHGADPSHVDRNGRTPVFEAAYYGHVEVLAILCDSSAETGVGWTAAHTGLAYTAREIALLRGNSDVVQVSDLLQLTMVQTS
jgi:ankyrin repeat protein